MLAGLSKTCPFSFSRFFSLSVQEIEKKCDELFTKHIEPILAEEGIGVTFHGITDGDCAVISLDGDALTSEGELRDKYLPGQILEVVTARIPEVTRITHKTAWET